MGAREGRPFRESRLVLNTKELACPVLRERVAGRFAGLGIGADRLDLRPGGSHVEMLAAYGEVDVALDPMPYSGGLTTWKRCGWAFQSSLCRDGASAPGTA